MEQKYPKLLGRGSFNVVVQLNETTARRISMWKVPGEEDTVAMLKRGRAIQAIFKQNSFQQELGPSVLRSVGDLFESKTLPDEIVQVLDRVENFSMLEVNRINMQNLAPRGLKTKRATDYGKEDFVFFSNDMEMLQMTADADWEHTAFMLTWFLAFAQIRLGFSHRDIKMGNYGFRVNNEPKTYTFSIKHTGEMFELHNVKHVPVLFDYDLGSLYATEDEKARKRFGTIACAPIEMMASYINERKLHNNEKRMGGTGVFHLDMGIDWWCLGLVLLQPILKSKKIPTDNVLVTFPKDSGLTLIEKTFVNAFVLLTRVIHYGDPVNGTFKSVYPDAYAWVQEQVDLYYDSKSEEIARQWRQSFEEFGYQDMLKRMLDWDPIQRTFSGECASYISSYFSSKFGVENMSVESEQLFTAKGWNFNSHPISIERIHEKYPAIKSKVQQQKQDFLLLSQEK